MPKARNVKRFETPPSKPYVIEEVKIENGPERSTIHRLHGPRMSKWGSFGELAGLRMLLNIAYAEGAKSAAKKGRKKR